MARMNKQQSIKLVAGKKIMSKSADAKDASPKDGIRNGFKSETNKITFPRRITKQMRQGMY